MFANHFISRLFFPARQRPRCRPDFLTGIILVYLRHGLCLDDQFVAHVEVWAVTVIDHNVNFVPVCWDVLYGRPWTHRPNVLQAQNLFSKDWVISRNSFVVFRILGISRLVRASVAQQFLLSQFLIQANVGVVVPLLNVVQQHRGFSAYKGFIDEISCIALVCLFIGLIGDWLELIAIRAVPSSWKCWVWTLVSVL